MNYRMNIYDFAMIQLGKDYSDGAKGPDEFDNTGFTDYIFYELFGIDLMKDGYGVSESAKQMTGSIGNLTKYIEDDVHKEKYIDAINVGDLLFFHRLMIDENQCVSKNQYPGYVGIYLGDREFIHASYEDGKIVIDKLSDNWLKQLVASRDVISGIILKGNLE